MRVSVVICTYQRAASLRRTLLSVVEQARESDTEIVVVDNASSEDTANVVNGFASVRYVREEHLGLCHARNRGWHEADAPVVAFLDDDAIAAPGWLAAVRSAFADDDPTVGCVGGAVLPDWEAPAPVWLSPRVALGLTIIDWPGGRRPLTDLSAEWLAGANLACRVAALEAAGGFHPGLGRQGSRLLSGEEVFLQRRLMQCGYECVYEPAMRVHHGVPAVRLTHRWFRQRYFWQGVSDAVMELIEHSPTQARRARDIAASTATLLTRPARLAGLFRDTQDAAEFERQCWSWIAIGHLAGLLGMGGR
jgi:glycosyltransferase involved in cell wall biosynthesis